MEQFETLYKLDKPTDDEPVSGTEEKEKMSNLEGLVEPVTFELLENRYYNHEPLLDNEMEQVCRVSE